MKNIFKVGYVVSYDWRLLEHSLPTVYPYVDSITISLDCNNTTWSGNKFQLERSKLIELLNQIDSNKKIAIYEDSFYALHRSPIENETFQRNKLSSFMGPSGWHLQVDVDEYILKIENFIKYLSSISVHKKKTFTIFASWIPIIKKAPEGFYIVSFPNGRYETFPLAFYNPVFRSYRRTGFQHRLSRCLVFHQTLARQPEEVRQKLISWGHSKDFDGESFYKKWKSINHKNYQEIRNFHPVKPDLWPKLELIQADTINELMSIYQPPRVSEIRRLKVMILSIMFQGRENIFKRSVQI